MRKVLFNTSIVPEIIKFQPGWNCILTSLKHHYNGY